MLEFELEETYGDETKNVNRRAKNNAGRFEENQFMFQLTQHETEE